MKTLMLTAKSAQYRFLSDITEPSKRKYAESHGFEFLSEDHKDINRISWERVEFWIEGLKNYEWIFFTGCDSVITSYRRAPFYEISDFLYCVDGCGLNTDSFLMKSSTETIDLLHKTLAMEGRVSNEQDALQLALSGENILANFMANFPPRISEGSYHSDDVVDLYDHAYNMTGIKCAAQDPYDLNAYPAQYYPNAKENAWKPGALVCHLPGQSLEERIKFFSNLPSKLA